MELANTKLEPGIPKLLKPEYMAEALDDLNNDLRVVLQDWEEN